jgi:Fe-S oxidoreductase
MAFDSNLEQTIHTTGVLRCLECGKCTAICPVARYDGGFSPRATVGRAVAQREEELLQDDRLWTCLSCLQCSQVCPANVDYTTLTKAVRIEARRRGQVALCTHGEAIHVWMRMMTQPTLTQNRLDWLNPVNSRELHVRRQSTVDSNSEFIHHGSLFTSTTSDTLYFAGCTPYYDALFAPLGVAGVPVAQASIRVLNALGIQPQVLSDERCCGHDLLWEGDIDRFTQLAHLNAAMIHAAGVKRIVSSCPECVRALKVDYAAHGIQLKAQVVHLSELIADSLDRLPIQPPCNLSERSGDPAQFAGQSPIPNPAGALRSLHTVTFHDPCRLGRHLGIYDAPRQVLEKLGYEVVEMPHHRRNATCCGTNGWTHCGAANKAIQVQRLTEAKATGADAMVTACVKCQIHFKCALMDQPLKRAIGLEMFDLATLVAARL